MLEKNGVRIAAVSYDSQEILKGFAEKHGIGYPLLSDQDSAVIRRFGIFNVNIAPGLRAHGVPHPVNYLVAAGRQSDPEVFRAELPAPGNCVRSGSAGIRSGWSRTLRTVTLRSSALTVEIGLSGGKAFAGQEISFFARFKLEPGWHVYGTPLPERIHSHVDYFRRSQNRPPIL